MNAVAIVVVALLWTLSGVLALAETAFTRVSRIRLLALAEEGDKRARRVLRLLEHPEQTLNSVLLLVLGCQMIGATLLGTVLEPTLRRRRRRGRHRRRDRRRVHAVRGRAEDVRGAAHRARGARDLAAARVRHRASGRCAC